MGCCCAGGCLVVCEESIDLDVGRRERRVGFLITVRTEYVRLAAAGAAGDGSDERMDETALRSFRPPRPYSKLRRYASALGTTKLALMTYAGLKLSFSYPSRKSSRSVSMLLYITLHYNNLCKGLVLERERNEASTDDHPTATRSTSSSPPSFPPTMRKATWANSTSSRPHSHSRFLFAPSIPLSPLISGRRRSTLATSESMR